MRKYRKGEKVCLYLEGLTLIILKVIIEIYTCILCVCVYVCLF